MSRVVVLGATGTVGRPLVAELAARPGTEVVAVGRNKVLLEHLSRTLPIEGLHLDVTASAARELPAAAVLIDLTNAMNRHPRWTITAAERAVALLAEYRRLHPSARVAHTGSFALLTPRPDLAGRLADDIIWDNSYTISKSAGERAIARLHAAERPHVIRLGNMAVPDMAWTTAILRAVRDGAVADPSELAREAVLTDERQLADALFDDRPELSYIPAMAGFTWGEVINAVARATGQPELDVPAAGDDPDYSRPRLSPLLNRTLYATPLSTAGGPIEGLPGASLWLGPARALVRRQNAGPPNFPVPLPHYRAIPGAGRDEKLLAQLVERMARLFVSRGWAPLGADRAAKP
jgi:nucleoside-diphosphate-sugar epimerase